MTHPAVTAVVSVCTLCTAAHPIDDHPLFVATPLTAVASFTPGIEGPAVDAAGRVYAVNFARQQTIGVVSPVGEASVFVTLPGRSVGNGIRFDRRGRLIVADYVGHNILRIEPETRTLAVLAHEPRMHQPNDVAITADDVVFASDPDWKAGTGQVWRITPEGQVSLAAGAMGTTNGIEVSPDGRILYVNESVQRTIWAFRIADDGTLSDKRLVIRFDDAGLDGMRCDVDGRLYVTRYDKGTVAVITPDGAVVREVPVLGQKPSNICFGGPDGRTAYVTEVEHGRIVQFRVDRPGLEWQRRHAPPGANRHAR